MSPKGRPEDESDPQRASAEGSPVRAAPATAAMPVRAPVTAANAPVAADSAMPGWQRWLWLSLAVIALDFATKQMVLAGLRPGETVPILPVFTLVLAFNPGAAFSFLAGASGWQRWVFTAIAVVASVVIVWLLRRGGSRIYCAGLALILGGALGNLWDRITLGQVVDFLLFHWREWSYPAFNVADSAITVGAALVIIDSFRARRGAEKEV
jgi:signal peptidase II